jgi:Tol biopolymer transport system component
MRPIHWLVLVLAGAGAVPAFALGQDAPTLFAPGVISGPGGAGAAAFTPDGATVYFMRGNGDGFTVLESQRTGNGWSTPRPAPFSGRWRDLDPTMAPDGSYLLFVSNRPVRGDVPIDMTYKGQRHPGGGMNLWRVDRKGTGWGEPVRLPDLVNSCPTTFAPSVAGDGGLYYIGCAGPQQPLQLMHAAYRQGHYLPPEVVKLADANTTIRDPAIAPDGSFLVVSLKRAPSAAYRLAIAFRTADGWTTPQDLGDIANQGTSNMSSQLGPDHRTLYFSSDRATAKGGTGGNDNLWQLSLAPWIAAGPAVDAPWALPNDASPAFSRDGRTVVFARGRAATRRVYVSQQQGALWSAPQPAPFSGQAWMDLEPAMAPDGSYLVFVSNRPALPGDKTLDGAYEGQSAPGRGGNLWRVDRTAGGWGEPVHLPLPLNAGTSVYAPAVAADGSVYFMQPDSATGHFRLYRSRYARGRYQPPEPLSFSDGRVADYDPAIAPDQSYIVFSSDRPPSTAASSAIFIAFARGQGWGTPIPLGPSGIESRLAPDLSGLYFSGPDRRIHRFALAAWLEQHATGR